MKEQLAEIWSAIAYAVRAHKLTTTVVLAGVILFGIALLR